MKLVQIAVNDVLLMDAEPVLLHVQEPVYAGGERLSAPADGGVRPLRDQGADGLRTGKGLPCHIHAVGPRPGGPDQTDHGPLSNGLQLDVLLEVHLHFVLHLQALVPPPLEQLGHLAVLPLPGGRALGGQEDAQISAVKFLLEALLGDAVRNALVVHIVQKLLQGEFGSVVFRGKQAGIRPHPVG